jgi:cytochrome o ubiquinol oxidase subunit II
VVIPVVILSVLIPWRYRASNEKATYRPDWAHSNLLEFIWWTIPCVIIAILSVMVWVYTHRLDPYRSIAADKDTVMVEAIALDWKWLFIYPQYHTASVNEVVIPVNKPVRFFVASDAPMNSLEIPRLAGQIYAMTGMQTKLNIVATEIGTYRGLSTNFSGQGFSGMNFKVHVVSSADFDSWLSMVKKSPKQLTVAAYNQLILPSENNPVEYFSEPAKGLFENSILKWMGPMPGMHLGYDPDQQPRKE